MSVDGDILVLKRLPIFQFFLTEHLRLLVFGADKFVYRKGARIYRQNDIANGAMVVLSGRINLFRAQEESETFYESVEKGCLIGELALITDTIRAHSAYASEVTTVMALDRLRFLKLLEEYPYLADGVYQYVQNNFQLFIAQF